MASFSQEIYNQKCNPDPRDFFFSVLLISSCLEDVIMGDLDDCSVLYKYRNGQQGIIAINFYAF